MSFEFFLKCDSEVEKVSELGNVIPRNILGLNFHRKFSRKILRLRALEMKLSKISFTERILPASSFYLE